MKSLTGWCATLLLLAGTVAACAGDSTTSGLPPISNSRPGGTKPAVFTDPFAYCAAVGTVDSPDSPYEGPRITDQIIRGYKLAAGLQTSTEPEDLMRQTTIWRCMGGMVYACNFGANLPCDSKAETSDIASAAMQNFCAANADSASIPMSVTGHATIYSWHCAGTYAATAEQIDEADAAGYLERIWYQVRPAP